MTDVFLIFAGLGFAAFAATAVLWVAGPVGIRRLSWRWIRSTHVTILGVLGIAVGLTVVVVVKSIVEGLMDELHNRMRAVASDVTIYNHFNEQLLDRLERHPGINAAAGHVEAPVGILKIRTEGGITIKQCRPAGIDPPREFRVSRLSDYIRLSDDHPLEGNWIIGGRDLFDAPRVAPGDKVTLQIAFRQEGAWRRSKPQEFTVAGILETGFFEIDRSMVYVSAEFMRRAMADGRPDYRIHLRLAPGADVHTVMDELPDEFRFRYNTYREQFGHYLRAVEDQGGKLVLMSSMIIVVAAVCVLATVVMITLQKVRDIGILRSVGAGRGTVLGAFLSYALMVGLAGAGLGLAGSALALWKIDVVKDVVMKVTGYDPITKKIYTEEKLPVNWKAPMGRSRLIEAGGRVPFIVLIPAASIGLMVLGALVPAWLAARRDPVEAILYE